MSQTQRLAQLAAERPDEIGYRHVRIDGSEEVVSYGWLDGGRRPAGCRARRTRRRPR